MGASHDSHDKKATASSSESVGFNWKKILGWLVAGYIFASYFAGAPGKIITGIIAKRAESFTVGGEAYRTLQKEISDLWGSLLMQTGAHFAEKLFWLAIIIMAYVHFGKIKEALVWAYGKVFSGPKRPGAKAVPKDDHGSGDESAHRHEDDHDHAAVSSGDSSLRSKLTPVVWRTIAFCTIAGILIGLVVHYLA